MAAIEWVKKQLAFYRDDWDGTLRDIYESDVAALEEILGYLEGYDPAERLPDYDVPVRIRWEWDGTRCQTIATRTVYEGEEIWLPTNDTCNYVPFELVFRWHPLPKEGRDGD